MGQTVFLCMHISDKTITRHIVHQYASVAFFALNQSDGEEVWKRGGETGRWLQSSLEFEEVDRFKS